MPTTKTERHRKIEGWENICQANQSQETALRSGSHSPLLCCLSPWTTIPRLSYHFVLHGFAQWEALTENKRTDGGRKQLFLIATLLWKAPPSVFSASDVWLLPWSYLLPHGICSSLWSKQTGSWGDGGSTGRNVRTVFYLSSLGLVWTLVSVPLREESSQHQGFDIYRS